MYTIKGNTKHVSINETMDVNVFRMFIKLDVTKKVVTKLRIYLSIRNEFGNL